MGASENYPVPGWLYRHHKGDEYRVLYVATNEADGEPVVVYGAAGGGGPVWVRPVASWLEIVPCPVGGSVPRFRRV